MDGFSNTVLTWFFGSWIFAGQNQTNAADSVTPLTIFASYFSTVGLAMFGLLGSWAIFLGIFRLRQGGNFFGAQNANESFFYPMRMAFSMALCAPVVLVASVGGSNIMLTPGHALIAGIAKTASGFGDEAQASSFELMNRYNLFKEPNFKIAVDPRASLDMITSWRVAALEVGTAKFRDPHTLLGNLTPNEIAQALLEIKWNKQVEGDDLKVEVSVEPAVAAFLDRLTAASPVPVIAPTDALARQTSFKASGLVADDADLGTVAREKESEGWFCEDSGWMSTAICSDEYQAVRKNNAASIAAGIAASQRLLWGEMVKMAYNDAATLMTDIPPDEAKKFYEDQAGYTRQLAIWYAKKASEIIRDTLANDQASRQEAYYAEVQDWGWMLGGTFVLRAAADFSRAAGYADDATSKMLPKTSLASLTVGDSLSKMVEGEALAQIQPGGANQEKSMFTSIFALDFLKDSAGPHAQNLHNTAAWGRALVGSGIGLYAGGTLAKFVSLEKTASLIKPIGVALIAGGAMLGYVLPMLFAIYGLMGAITWLVTVASTFFGVTLWAAGMAAPKGEEHTSQLSAKGFNALIFIGLYPALAVGGLAAAIVVSSVGLAMVQMLAMGLWGMFDPGTAEIGRPLETIGGALVGGAFVVAAVVFLSWNVVVTSAQLVTNFPRAVLNMISLSEPGLNPYENNMSGILGGISSSGRRVLTGSVSRMLTRNVSEAGKAVRSAAGGIR